MRRLEFERLVVKPELPVPGRPLTFSIFTASLNRWSLHRRIARVLFDPALGNYLVDLDVLKFFRHVQASSMRLKIFYPSRHRHPLTLLHRSLRHFLNFLRPL